MSGKMNLPNKLSLIRLCMVPFCIFAVVIPEAWLPADVSAVIAAIIFIAASLTDMLDGKIARKYGLITDFGKFIDPLADKFMVIGTMLAVVYRYDEIRAWFFWGVLIVIFREFAVTSIRLVASTTGGVVVAASKIGKIKTVTQIVCVVSSLTEPVIYRCIARFAPGFDMGTALPLTVASCVLMSFFTLWSGIDYIKTYWKYLDTTK